MEPGTLAKVLHDFFTTVDEELSLCKGEYFLVHRVIDRHWYFGESHNKMGKFPANHLHKVDIPPVTDTDQIFVSIAQFSGKEPEELSFGQGEIIVGTHEVTPDWYFGHINSKSGNFPITHTWQLNSTLLKNACSKKSVQKTAKVKATLKAQLDEELDLMEGDIVTVTEILEDGWCHGKTADGREGIFPEGFITFIEDSGNVEVSSNQEELSTMCISHNDHSEIGSKDFASYNMPNMHNSGSDTKDFGNYNVPYTDDPAPSYDEIFPEHKTSVTQNGIVSENDISINTLNVQPYAITLYPFYAQFPNELSFGSGQVIHLTRHIDSEWVEGVVDSEKGIFPKSYVNIIVNCTQEDNQDIASDNANSHVQTILEPGMSAKVEYTFLAQMDGDLSIIEGDVVTVVEMANDDWVTIKNEDGQVGLCPRAYIVPLPEQVSDESNELFHDALEDFVVIRKEEKSVVTNEEVKTKRLSQPHRPAPPVPSPGRVPLHARSTPEKNHLTENCNDQPTTENVPIDSKQKQADHRQNVISELVITEKEYVRDLKLTYETFHLYDSSFLESRGVDVSILFGNIVEVIKVAEELLDMILKAMKGCDEGAQTIGPCFLMMADKLQSAYVKYCGNHEAALALLKKYETNQEITTIFNKGIETLRHQIACFDMSSILIKPVQRILKYPLMLYELIKCTEDDHPDKQEIEEAWKVMTNVASYINEWKRRRDIVSKYLDNDNTFISKMAKLNMHSVVKKSARLSTKLSATLGLTNVAVDTEFEDLERQFKSVEKCTLQLAKDVEQSMSFLNAEALSGEVISNMLMEYQQGIPNSEIMKLREIRAIIWAQFIQDTKLCLEKRVLAPVNFLATLLEGPAMLITKRYDKLLDYDAAISKSEKYRESRIVQEELSTARSNYEALNQQLKEEIPTLIDASTNVLENCIGAFATARKLLSGRITKQYLTLCEGVTHLSQQDILESFLVTHNLLLNQITRFSFAGMNPKIEDDHPQCCPQSARHKTLLKNKYTSDKLYVVTENVSSATPVDLTASKGTLVAVIKRQDPMGNTSKWFVDDGSMKGFLPSQILRLLEQPCQYDQTIRNTVNRNSMSLASISRSNTPESIENQNSITDLMSLDSPEKEIKSSSTSNLHDLLTINFEPTMNTDNRYSNIGEVPALQVSQNANVFYYALYDFAGELPGTLSITNGQALKLVKPHDEKGNAEWWLMENRDGQKGYVPHNYLSSPTLIKR